ncbi:restriction endonuclease subunit S [Glutamicibacter sp. BW77]|uniref:restriction endonuclease subunit S n=1 Tax=Glutamicibacter TaxID=1742989 RepID=UPI000BB7654D|nr:restriction endonuclease subunit S [Glutamicibacter sp. BW77]PCC36219.1 hypothetical protein CIK74_06970 [Glutamicibacter sp. BW77]
MSNAATSPMSWIANTPSRWTVAPLGTHFDERIETVSDSDFPPLSVTRGGVVPQMEHVAKTDNNAHRKLVRIGDFAINSRSDRKGSAGLSELEGSVSVIYTVLTPRASLNGRFAHHLLRSTAFQEEFYRWGSGIVADLWSTRYSAMKRIPLALPPCDEQRVIADYLDHETAQIDALVAKQVEFIGLLRERRVSVVRTETSQFEGPYRIDKIGRSTKVGNGSTPKRDVEAYWTSGDVPWLTSSAVNLPVVNSADQFITEQAVRECHLPVVNHGDLLIGLIGQGPTRGKTTICRIRATLSQNLAYIAPDKNKWLSEYLLWALRATYSEIRQKGAESGAAQGMLNTDDIRRVRIAMPSIPEQKRIVAQLEKKTSSIDALIAKAVEHVALAKERRVALITAAVTGQFDVRTARKGA